VQDCLRNEARFSTVGDIRPQQPKTLSEASVRNSVQRSALYRELSHIARPAVRTGAATQ
jgi:hypothetical protein